jgi:hypothetical protein
MKKLYFEKQETIDACAKELEKQGEYVSKSTMTCACGQSSGYYTDTHKLILCEACYNDATPVERGE